MVCGGIVMEGEGRVRRTTKGDLKAVNVFRAVLKIGRRAVADGFAWTILSDVECVYNGQWIEDLFN